MVFTLSTLEAHKHKNSFDSKLPRNRGFFLVLIINAETGS